MRIFLISLCFFSYSAYAGSCFDSIEKISSRYYLAHVFQKILILGGKTDVYAKIDFKKAKQLDYVERLELFFKKIKKKEKIEVLLKSDMDFATLEKIFWGVQIGDLRVSPAQRLLISDLYFLTKGNRESIWPKNKNHYFSLSHLRGLLKRDKRFFSETAESLTGSLTSLDKILDYYRDAVILRALGDMRGISYPNKNKLEYLKGIIPQKSNFIISFVTFIENLRNKIDPVKDWEKPYLKFLFDDDQHFKFLDEEKNEIREMLSGVVERANLADIAKELQYIFGHELKISKLVDVSKLNLEKIESRYWKSKIAKKISNNTFKNDEYVQDPFLPEHFDRLEKIYENALSRRSFKDYQFHKLEDHVYINNLSKEHIQIRSAYFYKESRRLENAYYDLLADSMILNSDYDLLINWTVNYSFMKTDMGKKTLESSFSREGQHFPFQISMKELFDKKLKNHLLDISQYLPGPKMYHKAQIKSQVVLIGENAPALASTLPLEDFHRYLQELAPMLKAEILIKNKIHEVTLEIENIVHLYDIRKNDDFWAEDALKNLRAQFQKILKIKEEQEYYIASHLYFNEKLENLEMFSKRNSLQLHRIKILEKRIQFLIAQLNRPALFETLGLNNTKKLKPKESPLGALAYIHFADKEIHNAGLVLMLMSTVGIGLYTLPDLYSNTDEIRKRIDGFKKDLESLANVYFNF